MTGERYLPWDGYLQSRGASPSRGRVGTSCDEVEGLLPFLVMGTLDEHSRRLVVTHLANCRRCMEGLRATAALRDAVMETVSDLPGPPPDLLRKVRQRILAAAGPGMTARPEGSARSGGSQEALRSFVYETLVPEIADAFVPEVVGSLVKTVAWIERRVAHART